MKYNYKIIAHCMLFITVMPIAALSQQLAKKKDLKVAQQTITLDPSVLNKRIEDVSGLYKGFVRGGAYTSGAEGDFSGNDIMIAVEKATSHGQVTILLNGTIKVSNKKPSTPVLPENLTITTPLIVKGVTNKFLGEVVINHIKYNYDFAEGVSEGKKRFTGSITFTGQRAPVVSGIIYFATTETDMHLSKTD